MTSATLSDLPTELLLILFEQLKADTILNIGLTCRVLNRVAIPHFLERMGMPNPEKLAVIRPGHARYADKLTGLMFNFALTRIERLVCVLDNPKAEDFYCDRPGPLTRNMERIHHLIGRLSSVAAVSLVFLSVEDKWPLRSDVVEKFFSSFIKFLELLLLTSCSSIQIVHSYPLSIEPGVSFQRGTGTKHSRFRRFSRLLIHHSSTDPAADVTYTPLKNSPLPIPFQIPSPNTLACSHLQVFDFRMDFLLTPRLLEWTLAIMKHSPITSLTLSAIEKRRQREFHEYLFPRIARLLPGLQDIKLHFEGNEFLPTILQNLPLFPQLKKVTLAMAKAAKFPLDLNPTTNLHFPQLTSFNASLDQIMYFFNQNITCPILTSMGIIHTLSPNSEALSESLAALANHLSRLHLSPTISLCLDHIYGCLEFGEPGPSSWTASSHIISRLTLVQPTFPKKQQELGSQIENVLAWLSLFQGVKRLTVVIHRHVIDPPAGHERRQAAIRAAIIAVYPNIEFINLVQLKDVFHYHWSSARNSLERAIDGIPNVYLPRNKAMDYFVCCDL
jgi:hypothetical protein